MKNEVAIAEVRPPNIHSLILQQLIRVARHNYVILYFRSIIKVESVVNNGHPQI
jgi:hypothetical protein